MRLKDILVHLDGSARSDVRLRLAADLARRHGAHVAGLYVADLVLPSGFAGGFGDGAAAIGPMLERLREEAQATASEVETRFRETVRREGIEGEWRLVEGVAAEHVALHARYADLALVGQHDPAGEQPAASAIIERVLFTSGRPVLIVPFAGRFATTGRRVLVGWNASREATRAVHDALPLLAEAEEVAVLSVNPLRGPDAHGEVPGADIALHLARHGIKVEAAQTVSEEVGEGDVLLNQAADMAADLLVMGAYGHSRLREFVMGGVTRTILQRMTVPVLMSH
ncbi:universal stress protein [Caldovatus aquaticus]|uniref:Universal stress protein n=1 Tax=Caldovatus aquaticus TaxID=2865671 RepID=A0ABS7F357_9PROT|nr:universal stress protein [Caldovatus aquaticus]MBW8270041.1 universal stress protein [Caldovatus aquaticus]